MSDLTLPEFQAYLKSNKWRKEPNTFLKIVEAFRVKRNRYRTQAFRDRANVALEEADEYIAALRNVGYSMSNNNNNINNNNNYNNNNNNYNNNNNNNNNSNNNNSNRSNNNSNRSNNNSNYRNNNSEISPETLAKLAKLSPAKVSSNNSGSSSDLNTIFKVGAIVTLKGEFGRKMMVHKRGVNLKPQGVWLINEDGTSLTLNNGTKGPDLYGLDTIAAVNDIPFTAPYTPEESYSPESPERAITPAMCGTLTPEWIEQWVIDNYSGQPTGPSYGTRSQDIHPTFNTRFEIKGTMGDGTCLIHAFLTDVSPTYRSLTKTGKGVVGQAFRREVYQYLYPRKKDVVVDPRDFTYTSGISTRKGKDAKGNPRTYALARDYIGKTNGYLYNEDIEKLAKCFNIRIIALNPTLPENSRIQLIGSVNPKELKEEYDTEVAAGAPLTRYIFIYANPGHYESGKLKGAEEYIFTYPDLIDVINAAEGDVVTLSNIREFFTEGTDVTLKDGRKMVVAADEIRWESRDISPTESVLDPVGVWLKTETTGPKGELFILDEIAEVKGVAFNSSKYKPRSASSSSSSSASVRRTRRKVSLSSNSNVSPATLRRRLKTLKAQLRSLQRGSISSSSSTNKKKKGAKSKPSITYRKRRSSSST
jgi:hypothetical protein